MTREEKILALAPRAIRIACHRTRSEPWLREDAISAGYLAVIHVVDTYPSASDQELKLIMGKSVVNAIYSERERLKSSLNVSQATRWKARKKGVEIPDQVDANIAAMCKQRRDWDEEIRESLGRVCPERSLPLMIRVFGLDGDVAESPTDLAKRLGLSRTYVIKMRREIVERMRENLFEERETNG